MTAAQARDERVSELEAQVAALTQALDAKVQELVEAQQQAQVLASSSALKRCAEQAARI